MAFFIAARVWEQNVWRSPSPRAKSAAARRVRAHKWLASDGAMPSGDAPTTFIRFIDRATGIATVRRPACGSGSSWKPIRPLQRIRRRPLGELEGVGRKTGDGDSRLADPPAELPTLRVVGVGSGTDDGDS